MQLRKHLPGKLISSSSNIKAILISQSRYEYLVMKDSPDVVMCLGRNCNKGQSHTDANPMMICNSCQFKTCVAHKLPWHEGQTCDVFDMDESQLDRLERDEATAKLLAKEQSKICPNCHQGVTKQEGCDHMMCKLLLIPLL
jgi:hypothetical protein